MAAILLFWLEFGIAAGLAEPLSLEANQTHQLSGHLEVLEDASSRLSFAEVLSLEYQYSFKPLPGFFNKGFGVQTVWLRFQVSRQHSFPPEAFLSLGPPVLDYVTVYVQVMEQADLPASYRVYRLGDHVSARDSHRYHPEFVIPLSLPEQQMRWVYIQVKTTSNLALMGSIKPDDLLAYDTNMTLALQFFMLASFLLLGFIALVFGLRLKNLLYCYFALYLFSLLGNRLATTGILSLLLPSLAHNVDEMMVNLGGGLAWVFLALFGYKLYSDDLTRNQRSIFWGILVATDVAFLSLPWMPTSVFSKTHLIIGLCLIVYLLYLDIVIAKKTSRGGRWLYRLAFMVLFFGSLMQILRLTNWMPITYLGLNIIQMGAFGNIVLFSMAMAEQIRLDQQSALLAERNAKQNAEAMAVEMTFELRQKQQDLEQTLERQSRFVSMVSHEYRTPLTIIRTNLDLLSKKKHDPDGTLAFAVNKMKRAISRLVEVLEINLDKAKFTDDSFRLSLEKFALADFVEEVIHQAKEFWPERPLSLSQDDTDEMIVLGDPKLMKTVILNLLDNAVKYSPERTAVEVNLYRQGNECILSVTDHGLGIAPEEWDRVFEKNYRIPGNNHVIGSGIGLYLVARIVQEHQGGVSIRSDDNGTTATIRLPIV